MFRIGYTTGLHRTDERKKQTVYTSKMEALIIIITNQCMYINFQGRVIYEARTDFACLQKEINFGTLSFGKRTPRSLVASSLVGTSLKANSSHGTQAGKRWIYETD